MIHKPDQAMIPYFTALYLFHLCIAFTGFTFGVADMGIQSLILKYWGNQGLYSNNLSKYYLFCAL